MRAKISNQGLKFRLIPSLYPAPRTSLHFTIAAYANQFTPHCIHDMLG
ncbi:MAG: hypothetical protein K9I70_09620 [Chitinophagaceae bacterium]|nr:hypothetical protein [Chitinophagaceae bacterium]